MYYLPIVSLTEVNFIAGFKTVNMECLSLFTAMALNDSHSIQLLLLFPSSTLVAVLFQVHTTGVCKVDAL